ncbi:MAG: hypothetical protein ABI399_08920 [Bauldia sp.]
MRAIRFLCLAATLAVAATPAFAEWYVVMGSFPQGSPEVDDQLYMIANQCDLAAERGEGFDLVGMNPDVTLVFLGPYPSKARAKKALPAARRCVPDAFVKSATPRPAGDH